MHALNNARTYAQYDPSDVGFGIERIAEQVRMAWHDAQEIAIPKTYRKAKHIVFVGMGGSTLGAEMMTRMIEERAHIPCSVVRDYSIPSWVSKDTLVIAASFSGETEETRTAAECARKAGAMMMCIGAGGSLAVWAKKHKIPTYTFVPGDLAKQPRLALGFFLGGMLGLLVRAELVAVRDGEIDRAIMAMGEVTDLCAADVPYEENPAKQVAEALTGKAVLVVGAEHLVGVAHALANSIHESAKQFAAYFALPELNHHLLEGLSHPDTFAEQTAALFLHSSLYHSRTRKRFTITADVIEERGVHVVDYVARGKDALEEMCEVLQFSAYTAWYLALLNKENTLDIPFVDAFKEKMGKG